MAFKCVPLLAELTGDTKIDAHAIYRRPSGDLTSGLPMRRHHQWQAKGLEYVTLADASSLGKAAPFLRARGLNPQEFVCGHDGDGNATPWNPKAYLADRADQQAVEDADLAALVEKYGVDMVESIKGVKVPEHLKPGYVAPEPVAVAAEPEKAHKSRTMRAARPTVQ